MLRRLTGLVPAAEVAALREVAERHGFADGSATAGDLVQGVKQNRQLEDAGPDQATVDRIVLGALMRSREFNDAALPRLMMRPILNLYTAGMEYGFHVDNRIMNPGAPVRTDISVTVFLSDPRSFEAASSSSRCPPARRR
ncbi:MAG: hypothetical protein FJX67_13355 [Alphaproteobacteria bacterium]|nr:hypothetical protein [Alphaproteobacteria bacterium]